MKEHLSALLKKYLLISVLILVFGLIMGSGITYVYLYFKEKNSDDDAFTIASPNSSFLSARISPDSADIMRKNYLKGYNRLRIKYHDPSTANGTVIRAPYEGSIVDTGSLGRILRTNPDAIFIGIGVREVKMDSIHIDKIFTTVLYGVKNGKSGDEGSLMKDKDADVEDYTTPCPPCNVVIK